MNLKCFVKVSSVSNLSDARYCAGMGVDQIGFLLDSHHPEAISLQSFKEITEWLEGPQYIAEFENSSIEEMLEVAKTEGISGIQCTKADDLIALRKQYQGTLVWKISLSDDFSAKDQQKIREYGSLADQILLEKHEDQLAEKELNLIYELAQDYFVLLGFGISPYAIEEILKHGKLKGIALKGGEEEKPGYKDMDALADVLEALEIEDDF